MSSPRRLSRSIVVVVVLSLLLCHRGAESCHTVAQRSIDVLNEAARLSENLSVVRKYRYESSVKSFQKSSRTIYFKTDFLLDCTLIAPVSHIPARQCTITFDFIRTKITTDHDATQKSSRRQRRPPPGSDVRVEERIVVSKVTRERAKVEQQMDDVWQEMSEDPVRFTWLENGTISDIALPRAESGAEKNDTVSIKRAVVFAFQTSFDRSKVEVLENDELGVHYTDYSYTTDSRGSVHVFKTVSPSDFVDSSRRGGIRVSAAQTQTLDMQALAVRNANGNVHLGNKKASSRSSPTVHIPNTAFTVDVAYNLTLLSTVPRTVTGDEDVTKAVLEGIEWVVEAVRELAANAAVKDDAMGRRDLLARRLKSLSDQGGAVSVVTIFMQDVTKKTVLKPLRQVLHLERELFEIGEQFSTAVYNSIYPLVKANAVRCTYNWNLCFPLFELLVIGGQPDQILLPYLEDSKVAANMQQKLVNLLSTSKYPTEYLLQTMIDHYKMSRVPAAANHLLLAMSAVASKETISASSAGRVAALLRQITSPTPCHDSEKARLALEALGNLFTRRVSTLLETQASRVTEWADSILACSTRPEHRLAALSSLRNMPHREDVQLVYGDVLREGSCDERTRVVQLLIDQMEFHESAWPAVGVTSLDQLIIALRHVTCVAEIAQKYVEQKTWPRGFLVETEELVRSRRQMDGFMPETDVNCETWASSRIRSDFYIPSIQSQSQFDADVGRYGLKKKHCLIGLGISSEVVTAKVVAGFFTGISERNEHRLFGHVAAIAEFIGAEMPLADFYFIRETALDENGNMAFRGHTSLSLMGTTHLEEEQYECNVTVDDLSWGVSYTTPAFRITFSGFTFVLNADFEVRANLTLWPSHCASTGEMGIRFRPIAYIEMDAYAELENDFFGVGALSTLYLDYYIDSSMDMPSACFFLYHGNNDMYFKMDFYLKLPSFVFIDFSPQPIVMLQAYPVVTWQFLIKKSAKYVLFGWCAPNIIQGPEAFVWEVG